MTPPPRTARDYLGALLALLPSGRVWPKHPGGTLSRALSGLAPVYARNDARARALLVEAFPATSHELLAEWELTLELPDPCLGPAPDEDARRRSVVAKLVARGGQSAAYYTAVAAALGIPVTVQSYAPARFGHARYGDGMRGTRWAHAWSVHAALGPVVTAVFGAARYGDRFRSWGIRVLECVLREFAPAHAELFFVYDRGPPTHDLLTPTPGDAFVLDWSLLT